jgi:hypothetical protein
MKNTQLIILIILTLLTAMCRPGKKSTASPSTAASAPAATGNSTVASTVERPPSGVYAPGEEELLAIQKTYTEVTMQTLTEGHSIYTGVCTNCHAAKPIHPRTEDRWPGIIENMGNAAKISQREKDAVLKYVLAVKAVKAQGK